MTARASDAAHQLSFPLFGGNAHGKAGAWGGKRPGAGRKPVGKKACVAHRARPDHRPRYPVHVTLRSGLNVLRRQLVFGEIRSALALASRPTFRVVHFSVQTNHVHLVVEAHDKATLSSGVRGLVIRAARGVNRAVGRGGRVWTDRYHAHALKTPREVRNALVYVLLNRKKHGSFPRVLHLRMDPCSSAQWFDGWKVRPEPTGPEVAASAARGRRRTAAVGAANPPVVPARTWLATVGWRRHGLLRPDDAPAPP